ncbi:hypothetical protein [Flavobacterium sp.]|uniref:hypothetical protein n=1 Tax=Flavobacterium sp. TaxID=239 RepID=UPI003D11AC98
MRNSWWFLLLWCSCFFAQNKIVGKINSELGELDGILVVNRSLKIQTVSKNGGYFELEAYPNDVIVFTAQKIEPLEIRLNSNSFLQNPLYVRVRVKANELAEIKVASISAKRLGIVGDVKTYTPAERRLRTAEKFKWYSPLLIPFGGISVDGVINSISGRTAMLKKEVQVERFEMNNAKLRTLFSEDFYTTTLAMPAEYIDGFLVYVSENPKVIQNLKAKNTGALRFLLIEMAFKYKEMITQEK